jgi:hypothetical protein
MQWILISLHQYKSDTVKSEIRQRIVNSQTKMQPNTPRRASGRPSRRRIAFGEPDVTGRIHIMSVRRQTTESTQRTNAISDARTPSANGAMICYNCLEKNEYLDVLQNRLQGLRTMANSIQQVVDRPWTEEPLCEELSDNFSRMVSDSADFMA